MKKIKLTKGKFALVDDCDFEILSQYKWHATLNSYSGRGIRKPLDKWYARGYVDGRRVYMHRFLMGEPEGLVVNHDDANGLNNQRYNLEITTQVKNTEHCRFKSEDIDPDAPVMELEDLL